MSIEYRCSVKFLRVWVRRGRTITMLWSPPWYGSSIESNCKASLWLHEITFLFRIMGTSISVVPVWNFPLKTFEILSLVGIIDATPNWYVVLIILTLRCRLCWMDAARYHGSIPHLPAWQQCLRAQDFRRISRFAFSYSQKSIWQKLEWYRHRQRNNASN